RKDVTWDRLSAEDRDRFCLHVFRRVWKRVTVIALIYFLVFVIGTVSMISDSHPGPFLRWYEDRLDFVGDLINTEHWNIYDPYERSVFYYILIQALPIVVIEGGPLLVIVFAVTEYILRREMKGKGR
ncbi:MAG: hypothetical protein ACFNO6_05660, partial [Anaeroglobus sp.]